jgi:hypothetical protein
MRPNLFLAAALAGIALTAAGCASTPDVRVNSDPTANFSKYRTFGFADPLGTDRGGYPSSVSQHLNTTARTQLEARGLRYVESDPDLVVNFGAALDQKYRVSSTPTPTMGVGYYGYRTGMYAAYPMYQDQTTVTPYNEGTLNIDIADARRRQLVWEGVVRATVNDKTLSNIGPVLDTAVANAFAKYPVPVGDRKSVV